MTDTFIDDDDDEELPKLVDDEDEDDVQVEDETLFSMHSLKWVPDYKDGSIVAMAIGNHSILIATVKQKLFILPSKGDPIRFDIPKKHTGGEKNQIHKIFMDWNSNHILVTYATDANIYINVHKPKPILLSKCKGLVIESVVWDENFLNRSNTGIILFGTTEGGIYEMNINEGKERSFNKLYDFNTCRAIAATEPTKIFHESKTSARVCGLHVEYLLSPKDDSRSNARGSSRFSDHPQSSLLGMNSDSDDDEEISRKKSSAGGIREGKGGVTGDGLDISGPDRKQSLNSNLVGKDIGKQRFYVVAVIPNRIYEFIGGPNLSALFRAYDNKPEFKEVPGSIDHTSLGIFKPNNNITEMIGWLMEQGIALVKVSFGSHLKQGDRVVGDRLMENFIKFGGDDTAKDDDWHGMEKAMPLGFTMTPFHVLLVYSNCVLAVNILSKKCVQYIKIPQSSGAVMDVRAMTANVAYVVCEHQLYKIQSENETRDVWKLFLDQKEFDKANKYCRNNFQRQKVLRAEADHYFNLANYTEAAKKYAHLAYLSNAQAKKPENEKNQTNAKLNQNDGLQKPRDKLDVSFEEIALKFITVKETDALMVFLQETLSRARPEDKTQRTILATWLTELHLAKINRIEEIELEQNEASTANPKSSAMGNTNNTSVIKTDKVFAIEAFEKFLKQEKATLSQCKDMIFDLIASHGRTQQLLVFGEIQNDWTWIIRHYIQHSETKEAIRELSRLSDPAQHEQLYYDFAPILMHAHPKETINMILQVKVLDPKKLIPALMRFESNEEFYQSIQKNSSNNKDANIESEEKGMVDMKSTDAANIAGRERARNILTMSQEHTQEAIRYLENVIRSNSSQFKDPTIHNYLITLCCKLNDEGPLLKFIEWQGDEPHYDIKYALRLCYQEQRTRSCVKLYEKMGLYEEAVTLALQVPDNGLALAQSVVENFKRKEPGAIDEHKRLWLIIARHVVRDCQGDMSKPLKIISDSNCLSVEDILPHLNEFTTIGPFKSQIKSSLEKYSNNIKKLQDSMKKYTNTAEEIRKDTDILKRKSMVVVSSKKCNLSHQPVLGSQFLLFPCQHVFRLDAVVQKIVSHRNIDTSKMNFNEVLDMATKECPLCGQMMLEEVLKPFVDLEDQKDVVIAKSWLIRDEMTQSSHQDDSKMP